MDTPRQPRVVVGVDESLAGYAALRVALGIARTRRVPLHAVRASPAFSAVDATYITDAFTHACGGVPDDVEVTLTVSGENAVTALTRAAGDPRDLLVVGNDGRGMVRAVWSGSVGRQIFKHARCQLLVVPAPEMDRATRRSVRKMRSARSDVWDRFETEVPELRGRPYQGA